MKKYLFLVVLAVLTACTDDIVSDIPLADGKYTLTIEATKGSNESLTKALDLDETTSPATLIATWTEGDIVKVYKGNEEIGELTAQGNGAKTKLRGSVTTAPSATDVLTLKYLSPSYSAQDGTLEYIATHCDYAVASVTVNNYENGNITTSAATFENQQAIVKFTLKQKADNSDLAVTSLTVNDGTNDYTVTPTSATNELFVAIPATSTVNLSTTLGGISYSYEKTGAGLLASKYYEITVKMNRVLVNLASITDNTTLLNGDIVTGTLGNNYKISIAAGATVTLRNVSINSGGSWTSGNYAGLNCLGDATIVLADGTTNTVKGFNQNYPGIQAAKRSGEGEEYTLTIQGTGTLNASSNGYAAGIGGGHDISCGNIIINGGKITANGGTRAAGIGAGGVNSSGSPTCGDITINGGTVAAYGGSNAAGIGNGAYYTGGSPSCGDITINGGEVTATGGSGNQGGAGIGNGHSNGSCGAITISGGSVTATGGNGSAGIGGGYYQGNCGAIIISGGTVTATGGGNQEGAAGIGGGYNSACGDITISGGTVTANGGYKGVGIGSGYCADGGNILISGGTVTATGGSGRTGIGAGYGSNYHCGDITIKNTVTRVTATKGENAVHSIGISYSGRSNCGTVTIGGVVGAISTSPYTYETGTLSGLFTINGNGGKVRFSQGNLQATYDGSSWSWAFAANQWDYIGDAAGNTSINGNGTVSANNVTVDLFGWVGASSTWEGAAQYGISNSTATNNTDGYGNVNDEALKSDWGNTIGTGWRTLTKDEWQYVFNTRSGATSVNGTANARYTHATINTDGTGVNGMILFPDGVTIANGEATSWGTINGNSAWGTQCTSAEWTALAAKGCVFLPAAGYRSQATVYDVGSVGGRYWSSSLRTSNVYNAYNVYFVSGSLYPASYNGRALGCSVRLVRDAN